MSFRDHPRLLAIGSVFCAIILFALAYTQSPLYSSNQNTYFLQGLAQGGYGLLEQDWLAQTTDPFPLFTGLVRLGTSFVPEGVFYLLYTGLQGLYLLSMIGIADHLYRPSHPFKRAFLWIIVMLLHSAIFGLLSQRILGVKIGWYLQSGVAGQYILGPVFQPSTGGVFIIFSIYAFLKNRTFLALLSALLAALVHPSYYLAAAILGLTYLLLYVRRTGALRLAGLMLISTLVLSLPALIYLYRSFRPTSPEAYAAAQAILVNFRLPHHALPGNWFDATSIFQLAIILAALFILRKKEIFPILTVSTLVGLVLTCAQIATGNNNLALLFPWRVSVFLVPLSSTLLVAEVIHRLFHRFGAVLSNFKTLFYTVVITLSLVLASSGILLMRSGFIQGYIEFQDQRASSLYAFVESTKDSGDLYLIPTAMEDFRLATGAPIFVDQKTHPYKDFEVLEWFERLQAADDFYASLSTDLACGKLEQLSHQHGLTHVVLTSSQVLTCSSLEEHYRDNTFVLYRISDRP